MKINKENSIKYWEKLYEEKTEIIDFAGRLIKKSDYNNYNSEFGWNIDCIQLSDKDNKIFIDNYIICHLKSIEDKGRKTSFITNNKGFQIRRVKGTGKYEIVCLRDFNEDENHNSLNNEPKHIQLWLSNYGNQKVVKDFAGRIIKFQDYNNTMSDYSWELSFISKCQGETYSNSIIANTKTIKDKGDKNSFISNKKMFEIIRVDGVYKIIKKDYLENKYNFDSILSFLSNKKLSQSLSRVSYITIYLTDVIDYDGVQLFAGIIEEVLKKDPYFIDIEIKNSHIPTTKYIICTFKTTSKTKSSKFLDYSRLIVTYKKYFENLYNYNISVIYLDEVYKKFEDFEKDTVIKDKIIDYITQNIDKYKEENECLECCLFDDSEIEDDDGIIYINNEAYKNINNNKDIIKIGEDFYKYSYLNKELNNQITLYFKNQNKEKI